MSTLDLSSLTDELSKLWAAHLNYGWRFLFCLRDRLDELKEELGTQYKEQELLQQIGAALDMKPKTLWNKVNVARKPWAYLAHDLALTIGHGDAVLGLDDEVAEDLLQRAAEQLWTVSELRREVYMSKLMIRERDTGHVMVEQVHPPVNGNGIAYQYDTAEDDDTPYCGVQVYDHSQDDEEVPFADPVDPEDYAINLLADRGHAWCKEMCDELMYRLK